MVEGFKPSKETWGKIRKLDDSLSAQAHGSEKGGRIYKDSTVSWKNPPDNGTTFTSTRVLGRHGGSKIIDYTVVSTEPPGFTVRTVEFYPRGLLNRLAPATDYTEFVVGDPRTQRMEPTWQDKAKQAAAGLAQPTEETYEFIVRKLNEGIHRVK